MLAHVFRGKASFMVSVFLHFFATLYLAMGLALLLALICRAPIRTRDDVAGVRPGATTLRGSAPAWPHPQPGAR